MRRRRSSGELVNRVVGDDDLRAEADALLAKLAKGPTKAYANGKGAAEPPRLRRPARAARGRGRRAEGTGPLPGLHRGRPRVHAEARAQLHRPEPPMPVVPGWDQNDLAALELLRPLLDAGPYVPWTEGALRPRRCHGRQRDRPRRPAGDRRARLRAQHGPAGPAAARARRPPDQRRARARLGALVRSQLELEGLGDARAAGRGRPRPHSSGAPLYSPRPRCRRASRRTRIDLLLVDGPPGYGEGGAEPIPGPARSWRPGSRRLRS